MKRKLSTLLVSLTLTTAILADSDIEVCKYIASGQVIQDIYEQTHICPKTDSDYVNYFAGIDANANVLAERETQYPAKVYKKWIENYYKFLCLIKTNSKNLEQDMYKLDMFLTFRIAKDYEHNIGGKHNLTENDIRNFTSFVLNDPQKKGFNFTGILVLGKYYLNPIFIDKEVDTELKDFVGLINDGKFNEAYSLMLHSKRSNEGYTYMKSFCNRITKKELFK